MGEASDDDSPDIRTVKGLPRYDNRARASSNTFNRNAPETTSTAPATSNGLQLVTEKDIVPKLYDVNSNSASSSSEKGAAATGHADQDTKEANGQFSTLGPAIATSGRVGTATGTDNDIKPSWPQRAKAASRRFVLHTRDAICHSWINVLLIFVPIGIAVHWAPIPDNAKATVVFAMNAVAIIPLAGLLSHATVSVASRMGDTLAALLNVTFGNAVELIIFILALVKNQISIVQASILGSILANLLLILGMAFLLGGLRYQEQIYNRTATQMSAVLLSLSVMSLLLPTAFHASFASNNYADYQTVKISRGTSVVLLFVYILYLVFQLKSHAYMYESTPQQIIDEESHPGVLADMMNSSSSDSSDSSSSSDSDTSDGSHHTAKSRIRRAFRHRRGRKSSMSSNAPSTSLSTQDTELRSPTTVHSSDMSRHEVNDNFVLSGEDPGFDGEVEPSASRTKDREPGGSQQSVTSIPKRSRHQKKPKKKHNKERQPADSPTSKERAPTNRRASPHVDFEEQVEIRTTPDQTQYQPLSTAKRSFIMLRGNFRPPNHGAFATSVFTTPTPPSTQKGQLAPIALSLARSHELRRTSSLPDRLYQPANRTPLAQTSSEPLPRPTNMVMNQADALGKDDDKKPPMSRTAAVVLLLISTGLVAFCAELLVDAIPDMIEKTEVSQAFIGLIILPIVGNAAEHVTAVAVAMKNKMDLAIGIAVGSSIQIALFVTPFTVLLGWILGKDMSLYFNLFETVALFVTVFVVNFLVLDGRSNYLEGSLLISAYVIIALVAYYYPGTQDQSLLGGA